MNITYNQLADYSTRELIELIMELTKKVEELEEELTNK